MSPRVWPKPRLLRVLGIMSGTSVDGVDYAICRVSAARITLDTLWSVPFPTALRKRLHAAARGLATAYEVGQLHHDLGRFYASGAQPALEHGVDLAGLHGQTIFHRFDRRTPATFQIGEPVHLAATLHCPVVNNFRVADLAAGGQGAPLATLFHVRAFAKPGRHVCVNNLGGISNVTSIDQTAVHPRVLSFDTGPANVLIDLAMRHFSKGRLHFDRGGRWAEKGRVHSPLVEQWSRDPFFRLAPPKSTGRELFGEPFFAVALQAAQTARLRPEDFVATLTAFTARSVRLNYERHLGHTPDSVILTGGGASNPALVKLLRRELEEIGVREVVSSAERGWPVESVEAAAFALLAWERWHGRPGTLPATTGARQPTLSGQLTEWA